MRRVPGRGRLVIGRSPERLEDPRLLTGHGRFHDDVVRPGQLWMRVVRSPVAHARLEGVDASAALAHPGVVDVVTAEQFPPDLRIPVRQPHPGIDFEPYLQPPLARDHVRYVGEPVAAVLAESPQAAEDAAELVRLDLAELPVHLDARAATGDRPPSFGGRPAEVGVVASEYGDVDAAFARAAHVVAADLATGRHSGTPLEPRGLVAEQDPDTGRLVIWGATKVPFFIRRTLAAMLSVPEHRIHLPEGDAGGSFGVRGEFYPEDLLVPFLCLRHGGRPVKWSEDRAEHLVAANHGREQRHHVSLALDADGQLLGLRDEAWLDTGAYVRTHGAVVAVLTAAMLAGPYRLPACSSRVHIVATNKTPVGTVRAPGRVQNTFVREHVLDLAATRLGVDPVELRRRNLLDAAELPHRRPLQIFGAPMLLDGADHRGHFDKALDTVGYRQWQRTARQARDEGRLVGSGCAPILEKAGLGYDNAVVEVDVTGAVHVAMGGSSAGQGIATAMAQIAADELQVPLDRVDVVLSDTDRLTDGVGSFASRTTVVGGTAVALAAREVLARARRLAGRLASVPPEDFDLRDGALVPRDRPVAFPLARLAALARVPAHVRTGEEPGLVGRATYSADGMTYPYGAHFALAEVDPGTGTIDVLRYAMTYEIGRAVNPRMVHGQLLGGVVQGLGGALWEEFRYDELGRPLVTGLDTYRWIRAAEVPQIRIEVFEDSPAPGNPLGVRGAGEGGIAGVGAALANAVRDALQLEGDVGALPLHPARVLSLLDPATRR